MDNQGRFLSHVGSKSGLNEEQSKDADVHLEIPVFQFQRLRLRLWKNRKFTAPGFVIEKRGQIRRYNPNCHFKGIILDQPNSSVSISFCQGLVSFQANSIFFFFVYLLLFHQCHSVFNLYKNAFTSCGKTCQSVTVCTSCCHSWNLQRPHWQKNLSH